MQKPAYKWYYPADIENDLNGIDLPAAIKAEVLACAWEYSRSVIPQYTNWKRYVAFMRTIIIGTIAEFRGAMLDVTSDAPILGFDLDQVLADLFEGTPGHEDMAREYKTFLTVTSDKTSDRRDHELFRRYKKAVSSSPQNWFRLRDCDALCRFAIAAALACNDMDDVWFTDEQFDALAEIGDTMYDAIAFYKHRAEGETNNTFAYVPEDMRVDAFRTARETLWALDTAYADRPEMQVVVNFLRAFGGPIHMIMRRYRFCEEGLVIGKAEDTSVIDAARKHEKLWHRLDQQEIVLQQGVERCELIFSMENTLCFRGFVDILLDADRSDSPLEFPSSPVEKNGFGGALAHQAAGQIWKSYALRLPERVRRAFPEVCLTPSLPQAFAQPIETFPQGKVEAERVGASGAITQATQKRSYSGDDGGNGKQCKERRIDQRAQPTLVEV
ncbi:unnamed protein product [Zymoseptoria tritici ST99CH_3D7]|uniref:Uncharacterized protein n=1 Tax=Zymoseptoria tritici (strain ST99CH_3D7) TaxID=1276538 RepID=A0A1X7S6T4_ZYMT9|nr:unnamed protein product [Zymoseptoria tritici ST99CH_3D7]